VTLTATVCLPPVIQSGVSGDAVQIQVTGPGQDASILLCSAPEGSMNGCSLE